MNNLVKPLLNHYDYSHKKSNIVLLKTLLQF